MIILDGAREGDEELPTLLDILIDELNHSGAEVQTYSLRQINLGHCIGCFGCWLETPGNCIIADTGRELARAIIGSDMTVLFTPVTFGGYSSELKKIVDRWIPLILPYFDRYHGETHHKPRYLRYPRLVGIGVQQRPGSEEARIFRLLVGRNALNFHSPTHAADVVSATDAPDLLRRKFKELLSQVDTLPLGETITSLIPLPGTSIRGAEDYSPGRALLIVGSPKVKDPSTSGVLGEYVLERLKERGWETEILTLKANLRMEKGQAELLSAVERADLILLAFPLYIDALPYLVTKCLEIIGAHRLSRDSDGEKRLFVICNNGFPEAAQNSLALAICHRFAVEAGLTWDGALALGAGEALCSGEPLTAAGRKGRPPMKHVTRALDIASSALADGHTVPREAVRLMAKNPIPFVPLRLWHWIFTKGAARLWEDRVAGNRVTREQMLDRPYEKGG